ncbi:MAG TPA: hypothetical protein VMS31_05995 [Pyrinomonadaceae bacterium]|nr:hypothetical protein [Pyrinomonadaceae bacterium]
MKIIDSMTKPLLLILFATTTVCFLAANASAQICAGSNLRFVVRDEKGKVIDPTGTYETTERVKVEEFKDAPKVFKGVRENSVRVVRASGMCNFRQPVKVAVKLRGKVMNLTFLMPRFTEYESRSFLADSMPFRAGTFEIDLAMAGETNPAGGWLGSFFPAKGWKKAKTAVP